MAAASRNGFRVFVANLPWTIGSHELRQFGSSFGQVVHSSVVFDKNTGLSKGYGFLAFANRDAFNTLTQAGGSTNILEGNFLSINPAAGYNNPNISGSNADN